MLDLEGSVCVWKLPNRIKSQNITAQISPTIKVLAIEDVKAIFNLYIGILRERYFQTFLSRWPNVFGSLTEIRILTTSTNVSVNTNISLSERQSLFLQLATCFNLRGHKTAKIMQHIKRN
jgi:hypothetical protein